jgi:nitrite reductase/ring-hydroxylating ferredoxin subunit
MTVTVRPDAITACPSAWYLVAAASELQPKQILAVTVGAHELVLFRDGTGRAQALAAHCVHMGCHLKTGMVIADRLRCPLHFRQFDGAGRCRAIPGGRVAESPAQPTYPLIERFGALFVFVGRGPAHDLPAPHDLPAESFATLVMPSFHVALPWYAPIANGCDLDHLQTVHLRQLKEPPDVGPLPQRRFRIRYRTRVLGKHFADRLMRRLSGDDIRATITCFGGSLMLVESIVGRRSSFLLLSMRPDGDGTSLRGLVGLPRSRSPLLDRIAVRITAWLFRSFLSRDIGVLEGQRLHRPNPLVTAGDRYVAQLFDYFESLDRMPLNLVEPEVVNR